MALPKEHCRGNGRRNECDKRMRDRETRRRKIGHVGIFAVKIDIADMAVMLMLREAVLRHVQSGQELYGEKNDGKEQAARSSHPIRQAVIFF